MEKDMGVLVEDTLKPAMQCAAAASAVKANRILGQLSRAVKWRDRITFPKLYMYHLIWSMRGQCGILNWQAGYKEILEKV